MERHFIENVIIRYTDEVNTRIEQEKTTGNYNDQTWYMWLSFALL
jgi:hypothetical protein